MHFNSNQRSNNSTISRNFSLQNQDVKTHKRKHHWDFLKNVDMFAQPVKLLFHRNKDDLQSDTAVDSMGSIMGGVATIVFNCVMLAIMLILLLSLYSN